MLKIFRSALAFQPLRYFSAIHYQVLHDKKLKEFSLGDGTEKAVLQYQEVTPSIILLEHTIVPKSLQGKGLGKVLAEDRTIDLVIAKHIYSGSPCKGASTFCAVSEKGSTAIIEVEYAAFEYALDQNLKVKVSCNFVQKYLEKDPKPEFKSILYSD